MKRAVLLLAIIAFCACKSKRQACFIDATDIIRNSTKKLISVKDPGYKIIALYDEGWDSLKGGAYLFYPTEFLKSYTFYQAKQPVYSETYDEHGYLIKTVGSPMVSRVINDMGQDSAYVEVSFFKLMKTYQSLKIKINQNADENYPLQTDSIFSNMKTVTFGINTTDLNAVNMYTRITYTDDCTKTEHVLSDSLFLVKDSHNGLAPNNAK